MFGNFSLILAAILPNIPPELASGDDAPRLPLLDTSAARKPPLGGVGVACWNFDCDMWNVLGEAGVIGKSAITPVYTSIRNSREQTVKLDFSPSPAVPIALENGRIQFLQPLMMYWCDRSEEVEVNICVPPRAATG